MLEAVWRHQAQLELSKAPQSSSASRVRYSIYCIYLQIAPSSTKSVETRIDKSLSLIQLSTSNIYTQSVYRTSERCIHNQQNHQLALEGGPTSSGLRSLDLCKPRKFVGALRNRLVLESAQKALKSKTSYNQLRWLFESP
jgi:hypothetical protein